MKPNKTVLIATSNLGKQKELLSALLPLDGIDFVTLGDLGINIDVAETGQTYAENALIKAREYFRHSGMPTIAEDSGMEVSALKGELGVQTRYWGAGAKATDEEWLKHFMDRMQQEQDRDARFVCHGIYIDKGGYHSFEGECLGSITKDIEGPIYPGIPLSAVFKPLGAELVYSAMTEEEKNKLSHRGKAMKGMREWLLNSRT